MRTHKEKWMDTHGNFLVVYTEHKGYDKCREAIHEDFYSAHESYEDAKAEYDDMLRRDNDEKDSLDLHIISITAMVESSDYTPWKGIDLNKLEEGANE